MSKPRRRWSFVRTSRSTAFLLWEALGTVGIVALFAFLPFRYAVKKTAAQPFRSNGIFQLGKEESRRNSEFLDLRDPAGVLNTNGRAGYLSCLPTEPRQFSLTDERVDFSQNTHKKLAFIPLPEKEVRPAPAFPERVREVLPETTAGVMLTEKGARIAEIALPASLRAPGGQTVIRLSGGQEFPRSELLSSCGSAELDKLALAQSGKIARTSPAIITVLWPQQTGGKR